MENKELLYNSVNYLILFNLKLIQSYQIFLTKKSNSLFYTDDRIFESERLQQAITLKIAEIYKNIPIYLNTHAN